MNILFAPIRLEACDRSDALKRIKAELAGDLELRVVQVWRDQPLRLILRIHGLPETQITVPNDWLKGPVNEQEIRERLLGLLKMADQKKLSQHGAQTSVA